MNLSGSLDAFGLPDVFALLAMTGKSGALALHRGTDVRVEGVVWFHDGKVTGASADRTRLGLVRRLVGSGAVDDSALRAAVSRAAGSPVGVARALLEAGAVEAATVREAAVDETVDAVFALTRWPDGQFGFDPGARNTDDVGIALEHTWLVAEANARSAAWQELLEVVPSIDGVVSMPVVLEQDPTLNQQEWSLLALVDGRRTVRDLVELTGSGEFAVVTVLAGLARRGLAAVLPAGSGDHIAAVERRLALLRDAEGGSRSTAPEPEPVPEPEATTLPEPAESPAEEPAPAAEAAAPASPAPPGPLTAAAALAAARAGQGLAPGQSAARPAARHEVVPPRPEPFLPGRRVEHPENTPAYAETNLTPTAGATAMAVAPAPVPTGQGIIERDPAVNRSLLLRLIAGVRGL